MKMIYDRGSPKQVFEPHYVISEKEYLSKAVNLPKREEIPNIDLEVMNYHQPMLGTFHCKYMIVDRKEAILQSNNIQDNDNMEMMVHLEGPIVDSLYDMALISWHKKLEPPLPSANHPAAKGGLGTFGEKSHNDIFSQNGTIAGHSAVVHPDHIQTQPYAYTKRNYPAATPGEVSTGAEEKTHDTSRSDVYTGPATTDSVLHPLGQSQAHDDALIHKDQNEQHLAGTAPTTQLGQKFAEMGLESRSTNGTNVNGQALQGNRPAQAYAENGASRGEHAAQGHLMESGGIPPHGQQGIDQKASNQGPDATAAAFFESGAQALPQSQIEDPAGDGEFPEQFTTDSVHYDKDIAGEVARVQASVSPKEGETRMQAVTRMLNHTKNPNFAGTAPECAEHEEMTPYIPHPVHEPFPIAMVCREPYGPPNHSSVYNPQNEVWLSALRNAKKNVFIQSPTLNAEPLVPAIVEACERGIDVYCYICLGYNDTGELLPNQGGTNEMIAHKLYTTLSDKAKKNLHWFWYIGKDQTVPIVAKKKKRSCHIKVMIVDEHIGIQGNGNQDTQSWYHSQEINVMFDSGLVCKAWIDGLRRNQNTCIYGQVSQIDGIWRDEKGNQAEDVIGVDPGRFSWAKGFMGAIKRVQGTGDF